MLKLKNVGITRAATTLIENINLDLQDKQVVGIIGENGCGKSSLFAAIREQLDIAHGELSKRKNLVINHLEQEVVETDSTAINYTISGDSQLFKILQALEVAEMEGDTDAMMHCHTRLSELDGYSATARAAKILDGLGFTQEQLDYPISRFSGGWRMRISLAKCLFKESELLLLDEPTNHLDMEAIIWLEKFLKHYSGGILIVSHDRAFLDNTVTHILHIENKKAKLYKGNFTAFEVQRAEHIANVNAQYKKQQADIKHRMAFVDKFRYKATKARQAQSRLKAIEKMELIRPIYETGQFSFSFQTPERMPNPMVSLQEVDLGYDDTLVLRRITLSMRAGARLGLLGVNGAGKSTLIKSICGDLKPLKGKIICAPGADIGYFAQHQVDYLDLDETPLNILRKISNNTHEKQLLAYLGSFAFDRDQSYTPLSRFSGGEKARVALALIVWKKPNLLLLDEPTNHLDLEMRQALTFALQNYEGAILLVSHDRHLLTTLVDELLIIEKKKLRFYEGTVEDYQNTRM